MVENLSSASNVLFLYNKYEAILLSAYNNYTEYKRDKAVKYSYLNSQNILGDSPNPRKYAIKNLNYIRNFDFRLLSRNI